MAHPATRKFNTRPRTGEGEGKLARIRTIKPEFWTDSRTGTLSDIGKLLFLGMLNHSDDYGVIEYDAQSMRAKIFPYHSGSATELVDQPMLDQILPRGLAEMFTLQKTEGCAPRKYLFITNFSKHQVVNKPSKPLLDQWKLGDTPQSWASRTGSDYGSIPTPLPEPSGRKGREGRGKGKETPLAVSAKALPPGEPVNGNAVAYIPLNDGSEFGISAEQVLEFEKLYPAVNVPQTLNEIRGWNLAKPSRRKTRTGVLAHINGWLAKEQNRG